MPDQSGQVSQNGQQIASPNAAQSQVGGGALNMTTTVTNGTNTQQPFPGAASTTPAPGQAGSSSGANAGAQSQVDDASANDPITPANWTLDGALREIQRLRRTEAEYRTKAREVEAWSTKARELEAWKSEQERAQMTREERLAADLADAERVKSELIIRHQERAVAYETKIAAKELGLIDPDVAVKLIDAARIDYADDGTPKNLAELLRELVAAKPYLAASSSAAPASAGDTQPAQSRAASSPTNAPTSNGRTVTFTSQQIAAMSPQEYQQHKAAIMQAMREGRIQN